ncbi:hypothetical protein GmHk_06G016695 [Glycine max]|nr:hypothetical protein GmHk_06G016695 [Glycine max]
MTNANCPQESLHSVSNGNLRFDTAQTLVSRFLNVSSFFEDEGESPVESDEIKVQTWSSQHYRNEPMVVVAAPRLQKYSSFDDQSGEQPLLLPIRSLKSRLSEEDIDVQSLNMSMSSKRFSSYSNRKAEVEAVDVDVQYLNRSTTFKRFSSNSNRNEEVEADVCVWINGMLNEAQRKKVTESTSSQTFAMEGSVAVSNENSHLEQSENMEQDVGEMEKDKGLNKAFDMERNGEGGNINNAKATNETREIESDKDLAAQSAFIHEEFIGKQKVSKESVADQDIGLMRTECKVEEKKLKEIGVEKQQANEKIRAPEMTAGDAEHSGTQTEKEGDTVTKADYRGIEAAGPAAVQETVNVQKTAQWFHVGQSTESKAKSSPKKKKKKQKN